MSEIGLEVPDNLAPVEIASSWVRLRSSASGAKRECVLFFSLQLRVFHINEFILESSEPFRREVPLDSWLKCMLRVT